MTVNSFTSLSLDPPLVMWALRASSTRFDMLSQCGSFSVNVLAENQVALARRHAKSPPALVPVQEWGARVEGCPVIAGAAAQFVCRLSAQVPQGDHVLLVGEILHFVEGDGHPLLFMSGGFHSGKGMKPL
jgi:flavin reductase (DIM6/NTAB) family NADH-FMN oxidoreductase RutF